MDYIKAAETFLKYGWPGLFVLAAGGMFLLIFRLQKKEATGPQDHNTVRLFMVLVFALAVLVVIAQLLRPDDGEARLGNRGFILDVTTGDTADAGTNDWVYITLHGSTDSIVHR